MSTKQKIGRTTHPVADFPWPVVTEGMLGEKPGEDWGELKGALVRGVQALKEAELWLRKAERAARKENKVWVVVRSRDVLKELGRLQERVPLTVTNRRPKPFLNPRSCLNASSPA